MKDEDARGDMKSGAWKALLGVSPNLGYLWGVPLPGLILELGSPHFGNYLFREGTGSDRHHAAATLGFPYTGAHVGGTYNKESSVSGFTLAPPIFLKLPCLHCRHLSVFCSGFSASQGQGTVPDDVKAIIRHKGDIKSEGGVATDWIFLQGA